MTEKPPLFPKAGTTTSLWNEAIEASALVADAEWDKKPIVAPLTNAAYDEAARTIAANIRKLRRPT